MSKGIYKEDLENYIKTISELQSIGELERLQMLLVFNYLLGKCYELETCSSILPKWQTIKEFEASPEDGIYYVYTDDNEIKIAWYFKDQFYADEEREYGRWWITHVMPITLPVPPNNA